MILAYQQLLLVRASYPVLLICQPLPSLSVSSSCIAMPASVVLILPSIHLSRLFVTSTESLFDLTSASSFQSAMTSSSPSVSVWIRESKSLSTVTTQDGGFAMPVQLAHTNSQEKLPLFLVCLLRWTATTLLSVFNDENLHLQIQELETPR